MVILGQAVIVSNKCKVATYYQHRTGTWTYVIPRPLDGGTFIGGTKQNGDWNPFVDVTTRENLLQSATVICPELLKNGLPPLAGGFDVLCDVVGRRQSREGGPRIEWEDVEGTSILHAYGLGSSGYELSWGVAERVAELLETEVVGKKLIDMQ